MGKLFRWLFVAWALIVIALIAIVVALQPSAQRSRERVRQSMTQIYWDMQMDSAVVEHLVDRCESPQHDRQCCRQWAWGVIETNREVVDNCLRENISMSQKNEFLNCMDSAGIGVLRYRQ